MNVQEKVQQANPAIQELQLPQVVNPNPMVRNVNTVQTVNTNFPIINPAHTVYPGVGYTQPIQPAQPIAQPSF